EALGRILLAAPELDGVGRHDELEGLTPRVVLPGAGVVVGEVIALERPDERARLGVVGGDAVHLGDEATAGYYVERLACGAGHVGAGAGVDGGVERLRDGEERRRRADAIEVLDRLLEAARLDELGGVLLDARARFGE